jgi:thiol-disulfide isomerase/thioredoxin
VRTLLIIAGVVIVTVLALVYYTGGPQRPGAGLTPAMLAGAPASSFDVQRIDGSTDSLQNYRGKLVLVNLWATWCPPCREEMPALDKLYRQYRSRGFVVLGIDQGESAKVAAEYAHERGVSFPVLVDGEQEYGRAYAAEGLPTSVLVDRSGRILKGVDGEMSFEQMRTLVDAALKPS